ncbi:MAG: tetratricopeptide repeat protein [Acidobacteriota bacterium]|nr:tetratricopeptide repeat protein [Acidobacteriota bacterium]
MRCIRLSVIFVMVGLPSWMWAGTEEELIRLQNDILQLQNQLRLLQKSGDENGAILKSLLEQLNDQVANTNVQLGTTSSQFEALTEILRDQKKDQEDFTSQIQQKIQNLSIKWDDTNNRIAALQHAVQESQMQVQSLRQVPESDSSIDPDQIYSAVYNDYLMGNYDLAIAGFQDFLTNFPDSEYSDNASYYLGVCYDKKGLYEEAIKVFDQAINLYPRADKTPAAYFKKGSAQEGVKRNLEAIETWRKLATIFPGSQEAILAIQALDRLGVDTAEFQKTP